MSLLQGPLLPGPPARSQNSLPCCTRKQGQGVALGRPIGETEAHFPGSPPARPRICLAPSRLCLPGCEGPSIHRGGGLTGLHCPPRPPSAPAGYGVCWAGCSLPSAAVWGTQLPRGHRWRKGRGSHELGCCSEYSCWARGQASPHHLLGCLVTQNQGSHPWPRWPCTPGSLLAVHHRWPAGGRWSPSVTLGGATWEKSKPSPAAL